MTSTITNGNSSEISDRLASLEAKISQALIESQNKAASAGSALREIRDDHLYKQSHSAFELYCQEVWGFSRAQGLRLINYADIADDIKILNDQRSPGDKLILPDLESHCRALISVPKIDRGVVWAKVLDKLPEGDRMTAAHVERVVLKHLEENPPSRRQVATAPSKAIEAQEEACADQSTRSEEEVPGDQEVGGSAESDQETPIPTLAEVVASGRPAEAISLESPVGVVSKISNYTGKDFDFAIMDASNLSEKASGALDGLTRSLKKGARVAIFAEPVKACLIGADALAIGYEIEHSLAMDIGCSADDEGKLFGVSHVTILVLRWGDQSPRERVDHGVDRVEEFAGEGDYYSFLDSYNFGYSAAILLRAFSAPGDRVLCPTGGDAFIGEAIDYNSAVTYLASNQEKLNYYQELYGA